MVINERKYILRDKDGKIETSEMKVHRRVMGSVSENRSGTTEDVESF